MGQPGRGSRRRAVGVQEEGSPGSWRWDCRAALAHTRAPHTAASKRRWRPGVPGWAGDRKGEQPGRGLLGKVGWRRASCPPTDWPLRFLVWSNLEDSVRFEWKQSRLSGWEEFMGVSIKPACGGRGGCLLFIEGCVVCLCCVGNDYLG